MDAVCGFEPVEERGEHNGLAGRLLRATPVDVLLAGVDFNVSRASKYGVHISQGINSL